MPTTAPRLLAALVAFTPSFIFVLVGAPRFDHLRHDLRARAFLNGAGPAAIGAIIGVNTRCMGREPKRQVAPTS